MGGRLRLIRVMLYLLKALQALAAIQHLSIPVLRLLEVPMLLPILLLPGPFLMLLPSIPTHPHLPTTTPTHLLPQPLITLRIIIFLLSLNPVSMSAIAIGAVAVVEVEEDQQEDTSQQHRHGHPLPVSCTARVRSDLDDDHNFPFSICLYLKYLLLCCKLWNFYAFKDFNLHVLS